MEEEYRKLLPSYDIPLVLLGHEKTGKSTFFRQIKIQNKQQTNQRKMVEYSPTLGYEIYKYNETLFLNEVVQKIRVSLFDTAGKFEFNYLTIDHY